MTDKLAAGDRAPDFTLPDQHSREVTLSKVGGKVIVYFYPAAMTPGCTKQACDFSDSYQRLQSEGYTVLGISPDSVEKLSQFAARDKLAITLLSDADRTVMARWGAFGEKKLYGKVVTGVIRSTFVVEQGIITYAAYNVRATGHVAKLRRDLGLDAA